MELSAAGFFMLMVAYMNYFHYADDYITRKQQPTVNVPSLGQVVGSEMISTSGRKFQAFRGIPYGQPPVGNLRFREPVPVKSWGEKVLDATKEAPECLQLDFLSSGKKLAGQEDCLFLNVYTPSCDLAGDALPVLVWIHGGAFMIGSGNGEKDFYGPHYILDRDVILVTINYRLGALGFLSTEDAEAPGNYGLLDQALALKWVHDNIGYFGGNKDSVTIFGESAGGASVEFQVLSPYAKGLFHRAIAMSGSTRCSWALQTDVGKYTRELAKGVDCPTSSSKDLVGCLRAKDGNEIVEFRKKIMKPYGLGMFPVAFGPRIDAERTSPFLPDDPAALVARKEFNSVPYINGLTKDEGALFGSTLATFDGENLQAFNKDPIESVLYSLGMEKRSNGLEIAKKVYKRYFIDNKGKTIVEQYGEMLSDYAFFKCVDDSVDALSQYSDNPVYYYFYTHHGQHSLAKMQNVPLDVDYGVAHGDELLLMFTSNTTSRITDPSDIKVSNTLLDLITSFATIGVPKSNYVLGDWQPTEKDQTRYLKINAELTTLVNDSMPFKPDLAFWDDL